MGYFGMTYFDSLEHSNTAKKRDLNGESVVSEKGTDGKKNNSSAYNHDYYMKHKEKWQKDNKTSKDSKDSKDVKLDKDGKPISEDKEFDLDAAALDVIRGKYGNGQARKDALGADYEMIQKRVNEMYKQGLVGGGSKKTETKTAETKSTATPGKQWYEKYKDTTAAAKQKQAAKNEEKKQQQ